MENHVWSILEKKEKCTIFDRAILESIHNAIIRIIEVAPKEDIRILLDGMNHASYETFAIMEYYHLK